MSCIYNGDQSGLFYGNLPNNAYVYRETAKNITGVKIIKEKDSVTQMFCATSDGSKIALCAIGRIKVTICFRLLCATVGYWEWFENGISAPEECAVWFKYECIIYPIMIFDFYNTYILLIWYNNNDWLSLKQTCSRSTSPLFLRSISFDWTKNL